MTNIIIAVMLNYFCMPRTMFLESVKKWIFFFDDFAGPQQRLLIMISSLRNGRSHKQSDHCRHYGLIYLT